MDKYNAFTLWNGSIYSGFNGIAFGWSQFEAANWALVPTLIYWKIGFVVVIHFYYYLLNLLTMKELKPTTVAVFIYLQPVFASICYWLRQGWIKSGKILSAILIFVGVYLVTSSPKH
jgi:drug/metabolite transporter (DMT)-like permease